MNNHGLTRICLHNARESRTNLEQNFGREKGHALQNTTSSLEKQYFAKDGLQNAWTQSTTLKRNPLIIQKC